MIYSIRNRRHSAVGIDLILENQTAHLNKIIRTQHGLLLDFLAVQTRSEQPFQGASIHPVLALGDNGCRVAGQESKEPLNRDIGVFAATNAKFVS